MTENTYLRDGWNWLDFVVVVSGLIGLGGGGLDLSFLRTFRLLKALCVIPRMRVLISTVLQSIPRLGNVLMMMIFLFMVFGIMGVNFWNGVMYRICRPTP